MARTETTVKEHESTIEVPVDAGEIKFMLDVDKIRLVRDDETGEETLCLRVSVRGVSSNGEPLDVSTDAHLVAS